MRDALINFKRHVALLGSYFAQYAKVRVSYRGDFFISAATSMAATIFSLGFVFVLFKRVPTLANWRMEEGVFLYGFWLIPFGIFNIFSLNLYELGATYIMEGKFDRVLLRPLSSLFQVVFDAFRIESLQEVVVGLVVIVWASRRLHYPWHALDDLLQLHPIPAELDHSVRLRHLLSSLAPSRPPRISHLRASDSACCRGNVCACRHIVAHRTSPLFVDRILRKRFLTRRLLTQKKKKASFRQPFMKSDFSPGDNSKSFHHHQNAIVLIHAVARMFFHVPEHTAHNLFGIPFSQTADEFCDA